MVEPVTKLLVDVTFHGPLRIALGLGRDGTDAVVNPDRIPATSLKGVMRAAATRELGLTSDLVNAIFGTPLSPSPWAWTDLALTADQRRVAVRARIPIDNDAGAAARQGLFLAEELWITGTHRFTVDRTGPLGPETARRHLYLLAGAAGCLTSMGSSRRRGLGWVSCVAGVAGADGTLVPVTVDAVLAARDPNHGEGVTA